MRALRLLFLVSVTGIMMSCNSGKIDRLAQQNDSLRVELRKAEAMIASYAKIAKAVDSLQGFKKIAGANTKGSQHEVMARKIHAINDHVVRRDAEVTSLHKQLHSTRHENSAYAMMVFALKNELQIRVDEVTVLEGNIADVEAMNQELKTDKESAVNGLLSTINEKQALLAGLQNRLNKLEIDFRHTEAEAVYARAVAVEESARKTRFAPVRKKEALNEALELYKKAKSLGKQEAELNIQSLEKIATAKADPVAEPARF